MNFRYVVTAGCLIVATVLFQNCGGFSTSLLSTQLASIGIRADGCSQAARLFGGKCRVVKFSRIERVVGFETDFSGLRKNSFIQFLFRKGGKPRWINRHRRARLKLG